MIPICYNTHPPPSVLSLLSLQWRLRQHWGEFTQWLIFRLCHHIEKYAENSRITKTKCSVRQTQIIQRWWWWRDECDEVYWQTDSSRHFQCYFTTNLSPPSWTLGTGPWCVTFFFHHWEMARWSCGGNLHVRQNEQFEPSGRKEQTEHVINTEGHLSFVLNVTVPINTMTNTEQFI